MNRRVKAIFSGNVQGVGFRFTARETARGFSVAGAARNLRDGTVEIVAEGEEAELRRFLDAVRDGMSGCIRDVNENWGAPTGEYSGFGIAF